MISNINIKIDGNVYVGSPIKVIPKGFVLFWEYEPSQLTQVSFSLSLGTSSAGLGTDNFIGNVLRIINSNSPRQNFYFNPSISLPRSIEVYGQLQIKDNLDEFSSWHVFKLYVNNLPHILNSYIDPNYSISNGISLTINTPSDDVYVKTRWYKNGFLQNYLDDSSFVLGRNIDYGDTWSVEIIPYDNLEIGPVYDLPKISIPVPELSASNIAISPSSPNPDDILQLQYLLNKDGNIQTLGDESEIVWYINGVAVDSDTGGSYARLKLSPGDSVYARLTPSWGGFSGNSLFSDTVIVSDYLLSVYEATISGVGANNKVSYNSANLVWSLDNNLIDFVSGFSIKIGYSSGGDDVFSTMLSKSARNFLIPSEYLQKGLNYYISVAPIGISGNIGIYDTVSFSTQGDAWSSNVDPFVGYSIMCDVSCAYVYGAENTGDLLCFNIGDGYRSFSVEISPVILRLSINSFEKVQVDVDFNKKRSVIISVKNDRVFIYIDGILKIQEAILTDTSSRKYFNIIPRNNFGDLEVYLSSLSLSFRGAFHENDIASKNYYSFSEVIKLNSNSINDVEATPDGVLFSATDSYSGYSKLYKYNPYENYIDINIKNLDTQYFYVNKVSVSPNSKSFAISHSRGCSIFTGNPSVYWDSETVLLSNNDLINNKWTKFSYISSQSISFDSDGMYISTLYEDVGLPSNVSSNSQYQFNAISIKEKISLTNYSFSISEGFLNISNSDIQYFSYNLQLSNFNIGDLVSYIKSLSATIDGLTYLQDFYSIEILNFSANLAASDLIEFSADTDGEVLIDVLNRQNIIDPGIDNSQSSITGGKAFISHNSYGTQWFDYVNPLIGYSVELDIKIFRSQDSVRPINVNAPDIVGVYLNDGSYEDALNLSSHGIFVKNSNKNISINFNEFTKLRLTAKEGIAKIWKKELTDNEYILLDSYKQNKLVNTSTDARHQRLVSVNGDYHAIWVEDFGEYDVVKYSVSANGESWSSPATVPTGFVKIRSVDIAVNYNNEIFIAYETFYSSHSDIYVVSKNQYGWSSQYNISDNQGSSSDCRLYADEFNNIHLVWSDSRSGLYEIYYSQFNNASRKWNVNGDSIVKVTSSSVGAYSPVIHARSGVVYMAWTDQGSGGLSQIKSAYYNYINNQWQSSGQSGSDVIVSEASYTRANKVDILCDKDGSIHFVWHDYIPSLKFYKILHRISGPFLNFNSPSFLVTKSDEQSNCFNPKIGMADLNGDIVLVFEKRAQLQDKIIPLPEIDLTNPENVEIFVVEESLQSSSGSLFACRWIRSYRMWASSNSIINAGNGVTFGGYDSSIISSNSYIKNNAIVPKIFIYQPIMLLSMKEISGIDSFGNNPYSVIYALEFDTTLPSNTISYGEDPYDNFLIQLSQSGPLKSLSIGDMSDWGGVAMSLKYIKYSTSGEHEPSNFRKVGFMTHTMPSLPIINTIVADNGDAWIANSKGLYFYNNIYDQVFDAWSSLISNTTNLDYILNSASYEIIDFVSDHFGNFFIIIRINSKLNILVSTNHISWSQIVFKNQEYVIADNSDLKIGFNSDGDMLISQINNSCTIYNYIKLLKNISNSSKSGSDSSSSSSSSEGSIGLPLVEFAIDVYAEAPFVLSNININSASIDNDKNISIATSIGLYFGKIDSLLLLGKQDGLPNEIVNYVDIIDDYSRLCTFSDSLAIMSGSSFEKVNVIYIPSMLTANGIVVSTYTPAYFDSGNYVNAHYYNNSILIACKNGLIIVTDDDPILRRKLPKSAFFDSQSLDFIPANVANSIVSKEFKFSLPEDVKNNPKINDFVSEVFINNNLINFGYDFSASQETIVFKTSLLPSDAVSIKLRKDIAIENDFSQNQAEIEAFGYQSRSANLIMQDNGRLYATGGGDSAVELIRDNYALISGHKDYIAIYDPQLKLPYDEVSLDTIPPEGILKFVSQTGPFTVNLSIDPNTPVPPSDNKVYDETSGIGYMVISNYDNFTSDGSEPLPPVPFSQFFSHDLLASLSPTTSLYYNENVNFEKLFVYKAENDSTKLYAITSSPVRIYERSIGGLFNENPIATLEADVDIAVGFVEIFNNVLVIGTKSISGNGQGRIFVTTDLINFEQISILPGRGATSAFVSNYDRNMYIGVDASNAPEPFGQVLKYDGQAIGVYKTGLGSSVNCISGVERFLYIGSSPEGKIYRIDLASDIVEIVHIDISPSIVSIDTYGTSIYAGPSDRGVVIRSKTNNTGFTDSFKITPSNPNVIKTLEVYEVGDRIFIGIGNKVFSLRSAWTLEGSTEEDIVDIVVDEFGSVIYCSKHDIKITQAQSVTTRKVFMKLIDNAGNETVLSSAPDINPVDGYNDNYVITLTDAQLTTTYLQSRLLEVDDQGEILYSIEGDAPFYGGERILRESGVYFSEIFNGTAGHVSWNSISWEGSIPNGTYLKISIRVASSIEAIESSPYVFEMDQTSSREDISFISGQYLQLRIELGSSTNENPYVSKIVVINNAGTASHFFTTTFPIPSNIKRGIITTEKILPVGSDIVIGINGNDAADFGLYQVIPENRVFTVDLDKRGQGLKIGFRFITQQSNQGAGAGPNAGELPNYGSIIANSVEFNFVNNSGLARTLDFKVEFFADSALSNLIANVDTISSANLFRVNGNMFPSTGGVAVPPSYTYIIHCIPLDIQLSCDTNYFVRISTIENLVTSQLGPILPFRKLCGVNFINNIYFNYTNMTAIVQNVHFEISLYLDEARTSLYKTYGSIAQNASFKFFADFFDYPDGGLVLQPNESSLISLEFNAIELENFDPQQTYYVTVKYSNLFDDIPSPSVESMNYTFRASFIDNSIICGDQSGVPVLQGFAFMFELEDGSLVKFNYIS